MLQGTTLTIKSFDVTDYGRRLPLQVFTKTLPPGWQAGLADCPFRTFVTRLSIWWRLTDVAEMDAGLLVASRLNGKAFKVALSSRANRPTGGILTHYKGEKTLNLEPQVEVTAPHTGAIIDSEDASGLGHLVKAPVADFGVHEKDCATAILAKFFELKYGNKTLLRYPIISDGL